MALTFSTEIATICANEAAAGARVPVTRWLPRPSAGSVLP
jgi:hypothetical protein